jgi:hypothetical protein
MHRSHHQPVRSTRKATNLMLIGSGVAQNAEDSIDPSWVYNFHKIALIGISGKQKKTAPKQS